MKILNPPWHLGWRCVNTCGAGLHPSNHQQHTHLTWTLPHGFLGFPLGARHSWHCRSSFPAPAAWTAWVLREIRLAGSWSDDGSVDSLRPCHFSALPTQGWWELMEKPTHELLVSIDHWWFQPAGSKIMGGWPKWNNPLSIQPRSQGLNDWFDWLHLYIYIKSLTLTSLLHPLRSRLLKNRRKS